LFFPICAISGRRSSRKKFGIEAVIIRFNTQARLDREIQGDASVFQYYPYQIISIDYIKSDQRRQVLSMNARSLLLSMKRIPAQILRGLSTAISSNATRSLETSPQKKI